jgi:tRNA threonylcarbamoyladenosine biosynthesis protein TsaB
MIVLAVDTSTQQSGVALFGDGRTLAERRRVVTTHSEALLAMIDETFAEAALRPFDVDAIACGAGPGSFTGLRIGLATVKGLCFALGKPLVMISSLAALAARAPDGRVCAAVDAYKGEVYAGIFTVTGGVPELLDGKETVLPPSALLPRLASLGVEVIVGSGAAKYPELVAAPVRLLDEEAGPWPADVARLGTLRAARGHYDDLASATPTYIRLSEAELVKQRRSQ